MYKKSLLAAAIVVFTGCGVPNVLPAMKPEVAYIEFENYKEEVVPKLEVGYEVLEHLQRRQHKNITPEEFIARIQTKASLAETEIIMVDTDIVDDYYQFDAVYLKKVNVEKMVFGAVLNSDMPIELRKAFGSNKGCAIGKVYYNTPAYNSDIHENDIVQYANGEEITSCQHFKRILDDSNVVYLTLWVNGQIIKDQKVVLNKRNLF